MNFIRKIFFREDKENNIEKSKIRKYSDQETEYTLKEQSDQETEYTLKEQSDQETEYTLKEQSDQETECSGQETTEYTVKEQPSLDQERELEKKFLYSNENYPDLKNQFELFKIGFFSTKNNIIKRQLQDSCHSLYEYDKNEEYETELIYLQNPRVCYGCNKKKVIFHGNYVFSCQECGEKFQKNRQLQRDLTGYVCLVIGARTKLGHQTVIKLLDSGATVIGTSRYPEKALNSYSQYKKYEQWSSRLFFYDKSFDLDVNNLEEIIDQLYNFIFTKFNKLDVLINCAAQTIRAREKKDYTQIKDKNRYDDPKFVSARNTNSWNMKLSDLTQKEMEEVYRINAVAPTLIIQKMTNLMKKSNFNPYIINVHAREGLLNVYKSENHIHTNMAKCALAMLTKCCTSVKNLKTDDGKKFYIHGCDPGWISIDEYYENKKPWIVPPLDEIDGASRILYPLFAEKKSRAFTRRHFDSFIC